MGKLSVKKSTCINCGKAITKGCSFCAKCSRAGSKMANTPGHTCIVCGDLCKTLVCEYCFHFERPCPECNNPFSPKRKNQKYCSPSCTKLAVKKANDARYVQRQFPIFDRDSFTCIYCGQSPANTLGIILHVDHVIPQKLGGQTVAGNLVTACQRCNLSKAAKRLQTLSETFILDIVQKRNIKAGLPSDKKIRL